MKSRITALFLAVMMLLAMVSTASAVSIPTQADNSVLDEIPELPTMKCKNDGKTQTITMSEPISWVAAIFCDGKDWTWNEMTFTNDEHTQASVDMTSHAMSPGFGFWSNEWGAGNYKMSYAYDVVLANGTDVKYGRYGAPAQMEFTRTGTEYFGNGASKKATILVQFEEAAPTSNVGKNPYVANIKEEYADGTVISCFFAPNGTPRYAVLTDADGRQHEIYTRPRPESSTPAGGDEPSEEDLVLFEGSQKLNGQPDWEDGWIDRTDHLGLAGNDKMDQFVSGTSLKITWEFPYEDWKDADWSNGPMIVVQPTDNWVWAQAQSDGSTKAEGVSVFSFDTLAGINSLGGPTSDRDYKYFGIYPLGTELTITKVEIVK